jgi:hypothetical protein
LKHLRVFRNPHIEDIDHNEENHHCECEWKEVKNPVNNFLGSGNSCMIVLLRILRRQFILLSIVRLLIFALPRGTVGVLGVIAIG